MIEFLFWSLLALLIFIFFLYPVVIYGFSLFGSYKSMDGQIEPEVSIIISAYNEGKVIEEKIKNCLALKYPDDKKEIIIVSDGSSDNTDDILKRYTKNGHIKSILLPENGGKTNAINKAVTLSSNPYIVFTDANVMLEEDAIPQLINNFVDPSVGCVCGQLSYINDETNTAETGGLYWQYEEFIKRVESKTGSTMGADGSIFAIRSGLFRNLEDFLIDDFSTSMGVLFQGFRVIFETEAKAYERHSTNLKEELKRRRRIANRVFTAIRYFKNEIFRLKPLNFFKFLFHKFLRYLAAVLMILVFITNIPLLGMGTLYEILILGQLCFYFLAFIGLVWKRSNKLFYIPFYFISMNWMQLLGIIDSILGKRQVTWNSAKSSR